MLFLLHTVLTWITLVSLVFSVAVLLLRLPAFAPPTLLALQNDRLFTPGIWRLFAAALGLIALASIGELVLRAMEMSALAFPRALPVLSMVLLRTHYGSVWLARIACLLLLFILAEMKQERAASHGRYLMMALAVALAWTESASGHASRDGDFTLREMMDLIHLLAISAWGGGLITLAFVIVPFTRRADLIRIVAVTRRFSHVAGYAVGFVLLTAVYNMRISVGEFDALWRTSYGLTVLAKMLLLYFLLLLGALNRYLSLPLLEHAAGGRIVGPGLVARLIDRVLAGVRGHISLYVISIFRRLITVEAILILTAILCAALLKHQAPPGQQAGVSREHRMETKASPPDAAEGR